MQNRQFHSIHSIQPLDTNVLLLADNLRLSPDVLFASGGGIFASGVPGSGKTGILARTLEQASRFHLPMAVFDREGDLLSAVAHFPRGVIGTASSCPTAKDIIGQGLQVVFDLSTWEGTDIMGAFIVRMVNSLFNAVDGLPVSHRAPCLVVLDEAELFLPQTRGIVFRADVYKALADAFHNVATRGRKRGLVPCLFTQKLSEITKTCLTPGTYILLKQTVSTDQRRYLELIERRDIFQYMTERNIMQYIGSLPPGCGIVKTATGEQKIVQFYERESVHTSVTPTTQAALNLYSALPFNATQHFAADSDEESQPIPAPAPAPKQESAKKQGKVTQAIKKPSTEKQLCEKCCLQATHKLTYNVLRALSSGTVTEDRYKFYCNEHANRQCKPL